MVAVWVLLADVINPIVVLLAVIAMLPPPKRDDRIRGGWAVSLAAVITSVALAELGKWLPVWPGHPQFPSGHETLGVAVSTCLVSRNYKWLWIVGPCCVLLGFALIKAHFHQPIEVAGGVITGLLPPILFLRIERNANKRVDARFTGTLPE